MIGVAPATLSWDEEPAEYEARVMREAKSPRTLEAYRRGWAMFEKWAGPVVLPLDPLLIARFIEDMGETKAVATLELARSAIGDKHRQANIPDPTKTALVKAAMAALARKKGRRQRAATALAGQDWERVRTALSVRITKGGDRGWRALRDLAMMWVMRDTAARMGTALAIQWKDVGTGTVLIRRSKTDQEGEGRIKPLSPGVIRVLQAYRRSVDPAPGDVLFQLTPRVARDRIALAGRLAGLEGGRLSGHSLRRGTAVDLMRAGASDAQIMDACDWKSERTMRRYTEEQQAERSPVMRFLYPRD